MNRDTAAEAAQETDVLEPVTDKVSATVKAKAPESITPLTPAERKQLTKCEKVIKQGITAFKEVADALFDIRDSELYREEFTTFQEYCRVKWDFSARHANRLMLAGEVVKNIESDQLVSSVAAAVPENEAQSRPLEPLTASERIEVARKVAKKTSKPTAKDFKTAADEVIGQKSKGERLNASTDEQDQERPEVKSYDPRKESLNASQSISTKVANDTGDLEKLLELIDAAQTQAKKAPGCSDIVKKLGELAKVITHKLNGGGK